MRSLWEKLDLLSPVLSTAYRGCWFESPDIPKTLTVRQSDSSSSASPLKDLIADGGKPGELTFLATSIRTQSPEKHPIFARVLVSMKTKDSSSSSGPGLGCISSVGTFRSKASVLKIFPGLFPALAVVEVKLEYNDPGV
jgi:hypothetical protein